MQAVIIAAGESSRFWPLNTQHKTQVYLLGKPVMYWTLRGLKESGIEDVVVVHAKDSTIPDMLARENDLGVKLSYAAQEEPLGTGNALWQAKDFIKEPFFVLWPSKINSRELVARMQEKQKTDGSDAVLLGVSTDAPWDYGVVRFENNAVVEIVENPRAGEEPSNTKVTGAYWFQPDFFEYYEKLSRHHEADFVDAINAYLKDKKGSLLKLDTDVPALKYPWELFGVLEILLKSGYLKEQIASSAHVGANVGMEGPVYIGENVVIKDGTTIEGPAYIGDNCKIGYQNVFRGPVNLGKGVQTGAFMEVKHSIVQEETVFHSGYLGDSVVGKSCRFGAGFITGNVRIDKKAIHGLPKLGVMIGDNSIFGIHSGIMPGMLVGSNCKIGPATHVFENLRDNTTFYAKFEHVKKSH